MREIANADALVAMVLAAAAVQDRRFATAPYVITPRLVEIVPHFVQMSPDRLREVSRKGGLASPNNPTRGGI